MNFYAIILFTTVMVLVEGNKVDIAILVDDPYKSFVGFENYSFVLNEINLLIQNQTLGPNNTVAGIALSDCNYLEIFDNADDSYSKIEVKKFLDYYKRYYYNNFNTTINQTESCTREIKKNMEETIETIFVWDENRVDVADCMIVILFKDHSDNFSSIQTVAQLLGIEVYAIGIGNVTENYLKKVSGSSRRSIKINNFNLLRNALNSLLAYETSAKNIITLPVSPVFGCYDQLDLIFVLSTFGSRLTSHSITSGIINLIGKMNPLWLYTGYKRTYVPNNIRIGFVAYYGMEPTYLNLQDDIAKAIDALYDYNTLDTNVTKNYTAQTMTGMQKALDMFATDANRPDAQDIMVVVTDTVSSDLEMLEKVFNRAAANNVAVYTIGIGEQSYNSFLKLNGVHRTFYCYNHETFKFSMFRMCSK